MKLYTEKDLNKAMLEYIQGKSRYEIINSIKPIELPTDEEIEEAIMYMDRIEGSIWKAGAKWYREQLKQRQ